MVKKSYVWKVVDKTFDAFSSDGVKKLRIRAADSYAGLSEQKILKATNNHTKYHKIRVSDVMEKVERSLYTYLAYVVNKKEKFSDMRCR